jgi:LPS-assembly lipoprotein
MDVLAHALKTLHQMVLLACFLLAGCGWQLRDAQVVPENVGKIFLTSQQPNELLLNELTLALKLYGVESVRRDDQPDYSVVINDYRRIRRTSTLNSNARVAEYQLTEELDFVILDTNGRSLIGTSTATVERVYEFVENDVMASSQEERAIRKDMRIDIIRQIIDRLRVLPPVD